MTDSTTHSRELPDQGGEGPDGASAFDDPIMADVRAARAALLAEAGGTLEGLVALLKMTEAEHSERLVSRPPRPASTEGADEAA